MDWDKSNTRRLYYGYYYYFGIDVKYNKSNARSWGDLI